MTDYEDVFHPLGTDGDGVEEIPSAKGWFDDNEDDNKIQDDKKDKPKGLLGWLFG